MELSNYLQTSLSNAMAKAEAERLEYLTPESVILYMYDRDELFRELMMNVSQDFIHLPKLFGDFIKKNIDILEDKDEITEMSPQLEHALNYAARLATNADVETIDLPHFFSSVISLHESFSASYLTQNDKNGIQLLSTLCSQYGKDIINRLNNRSPKTNQINQAAQESLPDESFSSDSFYISEDDLPDFLTLDTENGKCVIKKKEKVSNSEELPNGLTLLNELAKTHSPLIGRNAELDRTIQVLCLKDKNNPLHVGEPGVGKTALVYGLTQRIIEGKVPNRLKGATVFLLDLPSLVAGTSYRGEFEKRIKEALQYAEKAKNPIIYIDEIHNIVGTGQVGESVLDTANILKPYLENGQIRFIGSTTYDEYNRHLSTKKSIIRRFQQIDIEEPSVDEAVQIIEGLKPIYEQFHHVIYADDVVRYAVESSAKYITSRHLPDKAIDLIDEAGAYRELHPLLNKNKRSKNYGTATNVKQIVDRQLVDDLLAKICKVKAEALRVDDNKLLSDLTERIQKRIYGQDEAVKQVSMAVQMSKAGLLDDTKPLASLLFVGPTGVGKTEVAKVLAQELGIELVRFDMSEYAEKHTISKLIGSPAGYVGYDDGGILTDAIRKSPNCVLLLDEIEKAHPDIFNILLQVMDYARLSDNKGQKADFRNVVLIMTSNAGAQYASQASVGFASHVTAGQAMLQQVKKTFKPEFINRLSGTVVFNDLSIDMARRVLDKKIGQLQSRLDARNIRLHLTNEAIDLLLQQGYNKANGAREMDRVINNKLNPLLMRAILYGNLQKGGDATIIVDGENLKIE